MAEIAVCIATHNKTGRRCACASFDKAACDTGRPMDYVNYMTRKCTSHHGFYVVQGTWEEWIEKLKA